MKALVCEMCGSNDIVKKDGLFVCQFCGVKYLPEEAKKLMADEMNISDKISNYYALAQNAYDAGNKQEAETYCNKIIEIDPEYYKAWFLKGSAAGWQSTLQKPRLSECVAAYNKAIDYAPEGIREELLIRVESEIIDLATAAAILRGKQFAKWPVEDEVNGLISDISYVLNNVTLFMTHSGITIPLPKLTAPIAKAINAYAGKAFEDVILPSYKENNGDHPDNYAWKKYVDRLGYCIDILEVANELCDENDADALLRYENLIYFRTEAINSHSWYYTATQHGLWWHKDQSLSGAAKQLHLNKIHEYEERIKCIRATVAQH